MLKLIRMNIYKLFRAKSFYVISAIMLMYCFIAGWASSSAGDDIEMCSNVISFFYAPITIMVYMIFVALYSVNEFSSGFIKSISSQVQGKHNIVLAKLTSLLFAQIIWYIYCTLIIVVSFEIFNDTSYDFDSQTFKVFGLTFLFTYSFTVLVTFISYLFRTKTASIVGALVLTSGTVELIIYMIQTLINHYADTNIKVTKYLLSTNISTLDLIMSSSDMIRVLIVSVTALVIYLAGSLISITKRDIR